MKALILFDGTPTSYLNLQAACQDAYRLQQRSHTPTQTVYNEALVIAFECLADKTGRPEMEYRRQVTEVLQQAIKRLERCGEFDKIEGEVIQCCSWDLTGVIVQRASEWKADVIYLAIADKEAQPALAPKELGWRRWLGIKAVVQSAERTYVPRSALNSQQVEVKRLLERTNSKVVLTNSDGAAMRVHYINPSKEQRQAIDLYPGPVPRQLEKVH